MHCPDQIVSLLKDLIAIPSVNPETGAGGQSGEREVCHYLAECLRHEGQDFWMEEVLPGRPNLYASLDFGASQTVLLSAHTDTVAAVGWDMDPFTPREEDGCIYGRGACDTKASLAVFAHVLLQARRAGRADCNLLFAAVCDEEAGFAGSRAAGKVLKADLAVAGEPTRLDVLCRHKGVARYRIQARGVSCHSSHPERGVNAVYALAQGIGRLQELSEQWQSVTDPQLGPRTLAVTTVSGGQAANIVPDLAEADVDVRLLPGDTEESVRNALAAAVSPSVTVPEAFMSSPALDSDCGAPLVARLIRCSGRPPAVAAYATDAAEYAALGIPGVVFGPGDIAVAHSPQEHVSLADLASVSTILHEFLGI